jgi:hypothetical protein
MLDRNRREVPHMNTASRDANFKRSAVVPLACRQGLDDAKGRRGGGIVHRGSVGGASAPAWHRYGAGR